MSSFSATSRVVLRRLFSITPFILSSLTSVGRPERCASLRSESPERKRANKIWLNQVVYLFDLTKWSNFSIPAEKKQISKPSE